MESVGMSNGGLMQRVVLEAIKKAMEVEKREIVSFIEGAFLQSPRHPQREASLKVAEAIGRGKAIDLRI